MLEQKVNALKTMVGLLLVGIVGLVGIDIALLEKVSRNQATLGQMRTETRGALEQRAPELSARLDRFERRMDVVEAEMNGLDGKIQVAGDKFVKRMEHELPGVLDRYIEVKARELARAPQR